MTQFKPGRMEKIAPIEKYIISKRCAPVSYGYHGHKERWGAIHLLHLGLSSVRMREEKVHVIQWILLMTSFKMASLPVLPVYLQEDTWDRYRPPDPKTTRSPKAKSFSLKHKTRSPADAVKESEQSLNQLLEDFEEGRLNAFGMIALMQCSLCMHLGL